MSSFTGGQRSERWEFLSRASRSHPCRYMALVDSALRCEYWDDALLGTEAVSCVPGGRECFESDSPGAIFDDRDGQWKTLVQFLQPLVAPEPMPETPPPMGPGMLTPRYCEQCEQRTVVLVNDWLVCVACKHRRLAILKDET